MSAVVIVGTGLQPFREYLLRSISAQHDVLLLEHESVTWPLDYATNYRAVSAWEFERVVPAVRDLVSTRAVDGILTWDEALLGLTAQLASSLRIPALSQDAAESCRDKARQRELLRRADVDKVTSVLVRDRAEAKAAAQHVRFPLVVKPATLAGSVGVQVVERADEFDDACERALSASLGTLGTTRGVVIEEFLQGPEFSLDVWSLDGVVEPLVAARKQLGGLPYREEIGHRVGNSITARHLADMTALARAAVLALGVDRAVCHVEIILTSAGPRIVEVNGRLGGGLIPYLGHLAGGRDPGAVAASVACGRPPGDDLGGRPGYAGIRFLYPEETIRFESIHVPAQLASQSWLCEVGETRRRGEVVRTPPSQFLGRAGYVIVTADSAAELDSRLDQVDREIEIVGERVPDGR